MMLHIRRRVWVVVILLVAAGGGADVAVRWWARTLEPGVNYSMIEEGLFMGGRVDGPPKGVRAVLNLSMADDATHGENYCWRPIVDGAPAPKLEWLREQVMFIDGQRRAGRAVFVHCDAGNSRSGMVVVAYVMWRDGCTRERALAYVRGKRETVRPNSAFMGLLERWEATVREEPEGAGTKPGGERDEGHAKA